MAESSFLIEVVSIVVCAKTCCPQVRKRSKKRKGLNLSAEALAKVDVLMLDDYAEVLKKLSIKINLLLLLINSCLIKYTHCPEMGRLCEYTRVSEMFYVP